MVKYTAEHGIKLLDYMGLKDKVSESEMEMFRSYWETYLIMSKNDPIRTTRKLYCIRLPIDAVKDEDLVKERTIEFDQKIKEKKIDEMILKGLHLDDILEFFG